ncbi:MAG: hypothetical protein R3C10_10905 [Pirellulales bacterium]|nr:hypothetical protein [Planctomycetales bacterium]
MEINRNQYFMMGLVVLMFGIQLRYLSSYVLNEKTTSFLAERFDQGDGASAVLPANGPGVKKRVTPPEWVGWAMLSFGAVLILHSLAMKRPGG